MKFSTITLIFSQLFNTASKLTVFIILMQLGGASTAGSYTLALAVVTPVFLLFAFSLREIYVTNRNDYYFISFLILRIIAGIIGILVVSIIGAIFYSESMLLIAAMGLCRFFELLVDIRIAYFQRMGRVHLMASSTLALAFFSSTSLIVCFSLSHSLPLAVLAASVASFAVFLATLLIGFDVDMPPQVEQDHEARKMLIRLPSALQIYRHGIMLSISAFAVSFGTNMPVLLSGSYHSETTVGLYSSIYNLMSVGTILFSSITQVELKSFSDYARKRQYIQLLKRGRKVILFSTGAGLLGGIIIVFGGDVLLELVFAQDFSDQQLPLLVMAATICLAPTGFILDAQLTSLHQFSVQGLLSVLTQLFTIIVSFALIPNFAILGGTLSVFLTMLVRNIAKYIVFRREMAKLMRSAI